MPTLRKREWCFSNSRPPCMHLCPVQMRADRQGLSTNQHTSRIACPPTTFRTGIVTLLHLRPHYHPEPRQYPFQAREKCRPPPSRLAVYPPHREAGQSQRLPRLDRRSPLTRLLLPGPPRRLFLYLVSRRSPLPAMSADYHPPAYQAGLDQSRNWPHGRPAWNGQAPRLLRQCPLVSRARQIRDVVHRRIAGRSRQEGEAGRRS